MSLTKKVGFNTVLQLIGRITTMAIAFLILTLLARYLGVEGYGKYTTIIAFLNFFAVIADFGLYLIAARDLAQEIDPRKKKAILNNSLGFRIFTAAILMLIAIGAALLTPYDHLVKLGITVFSIGMFFYLANPVINALFQVKLKAFWIVIAETLGRDELAPFTIIRRLMEYINP